MHILKYCFYQIFYTYMALKRTVNLSMIPSNQKGISSQTEPNIKLPNYSEGIIMIKQNYSKIFQNQGSLAAPLIKKLIVVFKDGANIPGMQIHLSAKDIQINIVDGKNVRCKLEQSKRIFPLNTNDTWSLVERKVWIQIDKRLNKISVNSGDVHKGKRQCLIQTQIIPSQMTRTWANEADKYGRKQFVTAQEVPFALKQRKRANLLFLQTVSFTILEDKIALNELTQKKQAPKIGELNEFYKIQMLKSKRKNGPVLQKNPTLLKVSIANLQTMEKQIQILYSWLEGLCLKKLPQYEVNQSNKGNYFDYLQWNNVRFSIHSSLVTPFTYVNKRPIGILNHLFYVKYGRPYTFLKPQNKKSDEILKQIYQTRQGYLRFQAIPPEGFAPGSNAVLQVWPPNNCSSIHNHGEAFGVIKVLGGDICVQNFEDLNFNTTNQPYMRNHYKEGNYTWLSEHSYSIHRLVNLHPQTCITLQSYMNTESSKQFFSVISKKGQQQSYIKYYPQHDWQNYLKKIKLNYENAKDKANIQFINDVIKYYGLEKNGKLDSSFTTFCMLLKQQYNILYNLIEKG